MSQCWLSFKFDVLKSEKSGATGDRVNRAKGTIIPLKVQALACYTSGELPLQVSGPQCIAHYHFRYILPTNNINFLIINYISF